MITPITAQKLIETLVDAMEKAKHPLGEGIFIVPAFYKIRLHSEVVEGLQPIMEQIKNEARRRMDRELKLKNKMAIKRPLFRFFEKLFVGTTNHDVPYRKADNFWTIQIEEGLDRDFLPAQIEIEVQFTIPISPKLPMDAGLATRTYTYYAVEEGFQGERSHYGTLKLVLPNGETTTFPLSEIETSIGRRDDQSPSAFADVEVSSHPNVSRLHGVFRYNLMGKYLEYQDRSRQGTKINGQLVQAQTWVKVLDGDQILLGEMVLLTLEAGK